MNAQRVIADLRELARRTSDERGAQRVAWGPGVARGARVVHGQGRVRARHHARSTDGREHLGHAARRVAEKPSCRQPPRLGARRRLARWLPRRVGGARGAAPSTPGHPAAHACTSSTGPMRKARGSGAASPDRRPRPARSMRRGSSRTSRIARARARRRARRERRCRSIAWATRTRASNALDAVAYLELHIEQGPVLESMKKPVGVVLGTMGVERQPDPVHRPGRALRRADPPAQGRVPRRRRVRARVPRDQRRGTRRRRRRGLHVRRRQGRAELRHRGAGLDGDLDRSARARCQGAGRDVTRRARGV